MISVKDEQGHSQVWSPTLANTFRAQKRIQAILQSLKPHSHVLELGCGHGELTLALLLAGHRVTAVDRSEAMLSMTRKRCRSHPALVLVSCDILDYLEKEGSVFDAVVGMGILHHCVLDFEKILRLIASRLTTHGRGFFWEPNRTNPLVRFLFGTQLGRRLMSLEPTEDAFTKNKIDAVVKNIYPRFSVAPHDWAYPFMPVALQKILTRLERISAINLTAAVSQSLWIELYKSVDEPLVAKTESPK